MHLLGLATELMPGVASQIFSLLTNGLMSDQYCLVLSDNGPVVVDIAVWYDIQFGGERMNIYTLSQYKV